MIVIAKYQEDEDDRNETSIDQSQCSNYVSPSRTSGNTETVSFSFKVHDTNDRKHFFQYEITIFQLFNRKSRTQSTPKMQQIIATTITDETKNEVRNKPDNQKIELEKTE